MKTKNQIDLDELFNDSSLGDNQSIGDNIAGIADLERLENNQEILDFWAGVGSNKKNYVLNLSFNKTDALMIHRILKEVIELNDQAELPKRGTLARSLVRSMLTDKAKIEQVIRFYAGV